MYLILFAILIIVMFVVSLYMIITSKAAEQKTGRRGVISIEVKYNYLDDLFCINYNNYTAHVLIVIEELGRVANLSEIRIINIDHTHSRASAEHHKIVKAVEKRLGQYWETDQIIWDNTDTKENEVEKIIKTPIEELMKDIESDAESIRNM